MLRAGQLAIGNFQYRFPTGIGKWSVVRLVAVIEEAHMEDNNPHIAGLQSALEVEAACCSWRC